MSTRQAKHLFPGSMVRNRHVTVLLAPHAGALSPLIWGHGVFGAFDLVDKVEERGRSVLKKK